MNYREVKEEDILKYGPHYEDYKVQKKGFSYFAVNLVL